MKSTSSAAKAEPVKAAPVKAKVTTRATKKVTPARVNLDPSVEEVRQMIATAAYFRAEKRGFEVGYEQEDWLMAEKEISQLLSS